MAISVWWVVALFVVGPIAFSLLAYRLKIRWLNALTIRLALFFFVVMAIWLGLGFQQPPERPVEPGSPFPWLGLLKSLAFWIVFLGVIGYSIAQYLRQHEEVLAGLQKIPGWKIVSAFWRWITGLFGGLNRRVASVIEAGKARLRPQGDSPGFSGVHRLTGLRRLSPRQKVFFYYHALLRRGEETGLQRKESQTPEEYAVALERSLPTIESEINSLTDAFSEARYSRHPVESDDVGHVKAYWERIRRVFRGRRG